MRLKVLALALLTGCSNPADVISLEPGFVDVSEEVGLEHKSGEYGGLWADLNQDGWLDLIFMNHGLPSLYINEEGSRFVNRFSESGLRDRDWLYPQHGDRHGGSCADYDNDGDIDLFISHGAMRGETLGIKYDELLNNSGDGRFHEVPPENGTPNRWGRGRMGSWADYDNDGWLDLYAGNFDSPNVLYRNRQDGTFEDVTEKMAAGHDGPRAAWADYDQDGKPDVVVAWPLKLLRNLSPDSFLDVTAEAGLDDLPHGSFPFSFAWGDADNDGDLDLFIGSRTRESSLFRNDGSRFSVAASFPLEADELGAGAAWGDIDNDGDLDLLFASLQRLRLYLNKGQGEFTQGIELLQQNPVLESGGEVALGDYDGDGYLDVAVVQARHLLLKNTRKGNSWIKIIFEGSSSNRQGFGAKVWVQPEGSDGSTPRLYREYWGDSGVYRSVGCGPIHVGLGQASSLSLRVLWPSGKETFLKDVAANQTLKIMEATGP